MYKHINEVRGLLDYKALELDSVAHTNGNDLTLTIASEECAELIQALSKVKRYPTKKERIDNLQEEVADVIICIEELISLGYVDIDEVIKWYKFKVEREIAKARKRKEEKKENELR